MEPLPPPTPLQALCGMLLACGAYLAWLAATGWAVLHKDTDAYFFIVRVGPMPGPVPGPVILMWLILPAMSAWTAYRRLRSRRWWLASRAAIIPTLAVVTILMPTEASVRYHFWTEHAAYDRTIRSALASGACQPESGPELDGIDCAGPVIAIFPWEGFADLWRGVVYDASDEIVRDPEQRSAKWRFRSTGEDLSCATVVEPLEGHFYLVFSGGNPTPQRTCS